MNKNLVTILDIGSTKTVCLAAAPDEEGGLEVAGLSISDSRGIKRGVIVDIDEAAKSIDNAIRRLKADLGHDVPGVVVGVGGAHIEGMNAQGFVPIYPRSRVISREDVLQVINHSRQVVLPPDREMIQALPREFRIDGQRGILKPIGMNGSKLECVTYIVTGQATHLQNVEKAIGMTGHRVDQMVLLPLASGLGALTQEQIELGSAVVDIGGGVTEIAIFSGGSVAFSASIPIGGALVTSDVSKLLKTSPEGAERLKTLHGVAMARNIAEKETVDVHQIGHATARPLQRKVLCEIIESRMRELAQMVKQQIEKSGMYGVLPGGVVLTGGGAMLEGTQNLFEDVLKHLRVEIVEPKVDGAAHGLTDRPGMAAALGMARFAIQCFGDELGPAGSAGWKERVRTFWSLLSGKA
ncbi:MAG: cell division protein FtsA [Fimbriimonadales bacterium]